MEDILKLVGQYGVATLVIAVCVIFVIGLLKVCKVFDKIQSKNLKKAIYYGLVVVLGFAGSAIYYGAFGLVWSGYVAFALAQISMTTLVYALYENWGLRKCLQVAFAWVLDKFVKWLKDKTQIDLDIVSIATSLGFSDEVIAAIKTEQERVKEVEAAAETTEETSTAETDTTKTA